MSKPAACESERGGRGGAGSAEVPESLVVLYPVAFLFIRGRGTRTIFVDKDFMQYNVFKRKGTENEM